MDRNPVIVGLLSGLACASITSADLAEVASEAGGIELPSKPVPLTPFQIPLNPNPYWTAPAQSGSIWGTGLLDVTSDGYPDIVTVLESGKCHLYKNAEGEVNATPGYDGDPEMAVSCCQFLGGRTEGHANLGGTLDPDPTWTATTGGNTLLCECWYSSDLELLLSAYPGARAQLFLNEPAAISDRAIGPPPLPALGVLSYPFASRARALNADGPFTIRGPSGRLARMSNGNGIGPDVAAGVYFVSASGSHPVRVTKLAN
ncbi:MAG: hypothetical protein JSU73_13200 [candidate division WOR-3 bacterium]|nr:MAG: hypothetical protein JSU73_13200 [candidate division WOR-3 bacterium]